MDADEYMLGVKLSGLATEYEHLLTCQLEEQRHHYEQLLAREAAKNAEGVCVSVCVGGCVGACVCVCVCSYDRVTGARVWETEVWEIIVSE